MHRWARRICPIVGIAVRVAGTPPKGPVFPASNHVTYADIAALTAIPVSSSPKPNQFPAVHRFIIRLSRHLSIGASPPRADRAESSILPRRQKRLRLPRRHHLRGDRVRPFRLLLQPATDACRDRPGRHAWSAPPPIVVADDVAY
jgi:hypothetical protein